MPYLRRRRSTGFPRSAGDLQGQRFLYHRLRPAQAPRREFREQGIRNGIGSVVQRQRRIVRQLQVRRQFVVRQRIGSRSRRRGRGFSLSDGRRYTQELSRAFGCGFFVFRVNIRAPLNMENLTGGQRCEH